MPIGRLQTGLPRSPINPEEGNESSVTPPTQQAPYSSRFLIADVTTPPQSHKTLQERFVKERNAMIEKAGEENWSTEKIIQELEHFLAQDSDYAAIAQRDYQLYLELGKAWLKKIKEGDTSQSAAKNAYKFVYGASSLAEAADDENGFNTAQLLIKELPDLKESESEAEKASRKDLKQLRDEALHYAKIGKDQNNPNLRTQALQKLKAIAQTEWGKQDWKTQYNFALLAYEGKYIDEAFEGAERASKLAKETDEKEKSEALLNGALKKYYGSVKLCLSPASDLKTGYIRPIPETQLIKPGKKKVFEDVEARLKSRLVTLPSFDDCINGKAEPLTLYLPGGRFYIGTSDAIEIKEGVDLAAQKVVLQGAEADNTGTYAGIALVAGIIAALGFGIASGLSGEEQGIKLVK